MKIMQSFRSLPGIILLFFCLSSAHAQESNENALTLTVSAGSHISKFGWNTFDIPGGSLTFPEYAWKPGVHTGLSLEKSLSRHFYIQADIDYMLTRMALETQGDILAVDDNGNQVVIRCDFIDKRTHQGVLSLGAGYNILPALSLEGNVFVNTDLAVEQSRICDVVDWTDTYGQDKNTGFGLSPSLVFRWKNWLLQGSYGIELAGNRGTFFTDEHGADVGKFDNYLQYLSLRLGYRFL